VTMNIPPWYKQGWPWVLIGMPLASMVIGFTLLYFAILDPDGLVVDDYYKQGRAINQDMARQRQAEQMGLLGELNLDTDNGTVSLHLPEVAAGVTQVKLYLLHPTRAHYDLQGVLYRDLSGALFGMINQPRNAHWRVMVEPEDQAWRLKGRLRVPGNGSTVLNPG